MNYFRQLLSCSAQLVTLVVWGCPLVIPGFLSAFMNPAVAEDLHVIVPGYERFRDANLTAVEAGRLLISELNCQSCHGAADTSSVTARQAPILTDTATRISPDFLRKFLAAPQLVKPGTAMPAFHSLQTGDASASRSIEAITAFLAQDSTFRFAAVGVDSVRRGERSFHRVGCAACHGDQRNAVDDRPDFVMPLGQLATKYSLSSLIQFLADPHHVRPSGRMPSLNLTPAEARDIASYLVQDVEAEANIRYEVYEGSWEQLPDFRTLTPVDSGVTTDISHSVAARNETFALRFSGYLHLPKSAEYQFWLSSDDGSRLTIDGSVLIDHDGVHAAGFRDSRVQLEAGAHEYVVEYFEYHGEESLTLELAGGGLARQPAAGFSYLTRDPPARNSDRRTVDPALIETGRTLFASLGCAACHQHGNGNDQIRWTRTAPEFSAMKTDRGCLNPDSDSSDLPRFALTDRQRADLRAAMAAARISESPDKDKQDQPGRAGGDERIPNRHSNAAIAETMLKLNCFACHQRDAVGGVPESLNHVFTGAIPEMGDEGRIPPSLDGVGDKLTSRWLKTVISEGAKDRPYMHTRMPKFGASSVGTLMDHLIARDLISDVPQVTFADAIHRVTADARLMVGDQALSCIKCHQFGEFRATGIQAMDLTTMTTRLRRDWFHRYLANPQQYRPGTRMPAAWPNGRSVVPAILDGTAATQIEAIWVYLADGPEAKIPTGLLTKSIELTPTDHPIIYRNFLEGLSPRGIAVGHPEKAHFAFDAEHMTVRTIWHGAFLDASRHWEGRGQGRQGPLGDHVMQLPAGPPLAELDSLTQPWPAGSAREDGFQFLGYKLNEHGQPTFHYTWHGIHVEDQMVPRTSEGDASFERTISFQRNQSDPPDRSQAVYFRTASARSVVEQQSVWSIDSAIRLSFASGQPVLREVQGVQELVVPLEWDEQGKTKIQYMIAW